MPVDNAGRHDAGDSGRDDRWRGQPAIRYEEGTSQRGNTNEQNAFVTVIHKRQREPESVGGVPQVSKVHINNPFSKRKRRLSVSLPSPPSQASDAKTKILSRPEEERCKK